MAFALKARRHRKHTLDDHPHMIDPVHYCVLFIPFGQIFPCGHMDIYDPMVTVIYIHLWWSCFNIDPSNVIDVIKSISSAMVLCLHSPTPKSFSSCNHQLVQLDYNLIVVKKGRFSKPKLKFIQSYHSFRWTGRHNPDWANAETRDKYLFQASKIQTNNNWCCSFVLVETRKQRRDK